jgi:hypothetical protein
MRDPESFGMKSKIFTSKPYLEKDCYLLLAALKALEGADSDVAGYFSKAFYRNPNDRWIYELARRLIPSYLDKDLLGFGINDGKNLGEKLNTGRIISQERSGY